MLIFFRGMYRTKQTAIAARTARNNQRANRQNEVDQTALQFGAGIVLFQVLQVEQPAVLGVYHAGLSDPTVCPGHPAHLGHSPQGKQGHNDNGCDGIEDVGNDMVEGLDGAAIAQL